MSATISPVDRGWDNWPQVWRWQHLASAVELAFIRLLAAISLPQLRHDMRKSMP